MEVPVLKVHGSYCGKAGDGVFTQEVCRNVGLFGANSVECFCCVLCVNYFCIIYVFYFVCYVRNSSDDVDYIGVVTMVFAQHGVRFLFQFGQCKASLKPELCVVLSEVFDEASPSA